MIDITKMQFIHYGNTKLEPIRISKLDNSYLNKPNIGLWASPIGEEYYTWKEWCEAEDFRKCDDDNSFKFHLSDKANILIIDHPDVLLQLKQRQLLIGKPESSLNVVLDYDKIISNKLYDGVLLIHGNYYNLFHSGCKLNNTYINKYIDFYSWDCDSIVIWNTDIIKED